MSFGQEGGWFSQNWTAMMNANYAFPLANYATLRQFASTEIKMVYITGVYGTLSPAPTSGIFILDDHDLNTVDDGGTVLVTVQGKRWKRVYTGSLSPGWFGALMDGSTDDGIALNLSINKMRTLVNAAPANIASLAVDLQGKILRTTISINATGLIEGCGIWNGVIFGECTGKAILDGIGSRSLSLRNLTIRGSQTNMPSVGIQCARSSVVGFGFCDGWVWDKVFCDGWYSTAAMYTYGQEGSAGTRCKFWNSNKDAYVGIVMGQDIVPMFSDYLAPMTGSTSTINTRWSNCDWMFLPFAASCVPTAITKAASAVITSAGHPFHNGDVVTFGQISGMVEMNNLAGTVSAVTTNTFAVNINSTGFSVYTAGGNIVISQTKSTMKIGRVAGISFEDCYCVNYGADSIEVDFADGAQPKNVKLGFLFEGQASRSHLRFLQVGAINGLELNFYNSCARDAVISTAAVAGTITLLPCKIHMPNASASNPALFDTPARYAILGADITVPSVTQLTTTTLGANFTGSIKYTATGTITHTNELIADYRDGAFGPVAVSSTVGAITTASAIGTLRRNGKNLWFDVIITDTTNGTGAGVLNVAMPFSVAVAARLVGTIDNSNNVVIGIMSTGAPATLSVLKYDGTYPGGNGIIITISGMVLEA